MNEILKMRPSWLRIKPWGGKNYGEIKKSLRRFNINTVCDACLCPNKGVCWEIKNATIMILGDKCTRRCGFCSVQKKSPRRKIDYDEPLRVALAIKEWGLKYAVLTSPARDDLEDGGSGIYAETIKKIKELCNGIFIETLIPDYVGSNLKKVLDAKPFVLSHNIETIERIFPLIRDRRASYKKSLQTLYESKKIAPSIYTKSAIMVGFGEKEDEVIKTMKDLKDCGVEIFVIGQYLPPSKKHYPLKEYITLQKFEEFKKAGEEMGFLYVHSFPFARSSFMAMKFLDKACAKFNFF